jgi:hypothetical protein
MSVCAALMTLHRFQHRHRPVVRPPYDLKMIFFIYFLKKKRSQQMLEYLTETQQANVRAFDAAIIFNNGIGQLCALFFGKEKKIEPRHLRGPPSMPKTM